MENDLLKIILQIETLIDAAKGLPNNPVPDGINPAPEGSTFDARDISPLLTVNEKSRVKEIAKIFKEVLAPKPEAERIRPLSEQSQNRQIQQNLEIYRNDQSSRNGLGAAGSISDGIGGLIGGATGVLGGIKIAIVGLAAALGVSAIALAGGKAFQWIIEGLKAANGINWKGVGDLAKIFGMVIKDVSFVIKDLSTHLVKLGLDVAKGGLDIIKDIVKFSVDTIGSVAESLLKYGDVDWSDLGKAATAIAGFFTITGVIGIPNIAMYEAIGNALLTWANFNFNLFSKNISIFAQGLDNLGKAIKTYDDIQFDEFAKAFSYSFSLITGISVVGLTAPLAALGAFTAQLTAMGLDPIAATINHFATAIEAIGKAQKPFAEGLKELENVNPEHLGQLARSVSVLAGSIAEFGAGTAFNSFFNFFKSDELQGILALADKHEKLGCAAVAVGNLSKAFKSWTDLRLDNLGWNLKQIDQAVSNINPKKLEQIVKSSFELKIQQDEYTKHTYNYIVTGKSNDDDGSGLISITKEILQENRKLNTTAMQIRNTLVRIEDKQLGTNSSGSINITNPLEGRKTTTANPRDSITTMGLR